MTAKRAKGRRRPSASSLLALAEELCLRLGIEVVYAKLPPPRLVAHGARARVGGDRRFYVDQELPVTRRLAIVIEMLKNEPLDDVYLAPALRERLGATGVDQQQEETP
jgi:hypothetical protein